MRRGLLLSESPLPHPNTLFQFRFQELRVDQDDNVPQSSQASDWILPKPAEGSLSFHPTKI